MNSSRRQILSSLVDFLDRKSVMQEFYGYHHCNNSDDTPVPWEEFCRLVQCLEDEPEQGPPLSLTGKEGDLYVSDLHPNTTSQQLQDLFTKYGKIQHVMMSKDGALVRYEDKRDAEDARRSLNGTEFRGCIISVQQYTPRKLDEPISKNTDLVVVGVDKEEDLWALLELFGPIKRITESNNRAIVRFHDIRHAENAKIALDGSKTRHGTISVSWHTV